MKLLSTNSVSDITENASNAGSMENPLLYTAVNSRDATTPRISAPWTESESRKFVDICEKRREFLVRNSVKESKTSFLTEVLNQLTKAGYLRTYHSCSTRLQVAGITDVYWKGQKQVDRSNNSSVKEKKVLENGGQSDQHFRYEDKEIMSLLETFACYRERYPDPDIKNAFTTSSWHDIAATHNENGFNRTSQSIRSIWKRKLYMNFLSQYGNLYNHETDSAASSDSDYESSVSGTNAHGGSASEATSPGRSGQHWDEEEITALKASVDEVRNGDQKIRWIEVVVKLKEKGYSRTYAGVKMKWLELRGKTKRRGKNDIARAEDDDSDDDILHVPYKKVFQVVRVEFAMKLTITQARLDGMEKPQLIVKLKVKLTRVDHTASRSNLEHEMVQSAGVVCEQSNVKSAMTAEKQVSPEMTIINTVRKKAETHHEAAKMLKKHKVDKERQLDRTSGKLEHVEKQIQALQAQREEVLGTKASLEAEIAAHDERLQEEERFIRGFDSTIESLLKTMETA